MDAQKPLDFFYQVFSRFLISGLVFYLFVIWLPCFTYFRTENYKLISEPVFVILISIIIGLLLDISRFYNLLGKVIGSDKTQLREFIVQSFDIKFNAEQNDSEYKKKIKEVSRQIHDVYVKATYPDIDKRIRENRMYPDMLGITLLSILLFLGLGLIFLIGYSISTFLSGLSPIFSFLNLSFSPLRLFILVILNISLVLVVIFSRETERKHFQLSRDFTKQLIKECCLNSEVEIKHRFLESLNHDLLLFDKENNVWKIKESESH